MSQVGSCRQCVIHQFHACCHALSEL